MFAQAGNSLPDKVLDFPSHLFTSIEKEAAKTDQQLTKQVEKYLHKLYKAEAQLQKKMSKKDSVAANNLFRESESKYSNLSAGLTSSVDQSVKNPLHEYVPGLDSTQAAVNFIKVEAAKSGFDDSKLRQIEAASKELQILQTRLQRSADIEQFVRQREQQLKEQLSQYGLGKDLAAFNKEAFYYQQQLAEYKNMLHDPSKLEQKLLSVLRENRVFQNFLAKNSFLGQLFGLPDNYGNIASLAGLQTRSQVEQLISTNMGSAAGGGGPDPQQLLAQQIQLAQQALRQLRNNLNILGNSGAGGDAIMPQFKPNSEHTKTFFKRLEYGFNIQSQPSSSLMPATTDFALILGYKLNNRTSFGVGASYRLGFGSGINHIHFTSQGIGLRSYIDIRAKGSLFISGGLEYNYMQQFESVRAIYSWDVWQKSALMGISKQLRVTKNKISNFQLLFDAFYKQHIPQSSPVVFRMGYKF